MGPTERRIPKIGMGQNGGFEIGEAQVPPRKVQPGNRFEHPIALRAVAPPQMTLLLHRQRIADEQRAGKPGPDRRRG